MSTCKRIAAIALLVLGTAPAVQAGDQLYLRWDSCFGDGGAYNRTFACNTNAGTDVLVASFRLDHAVAMAASLSADIYVVPIQFETLPSWWQFVRPGTCRQSSLQVTFAAPSNATACLDPWSGHLSVAAFDYFGSSGQGAIKTVEGVTAGSEFTLNAGQEYFAIQVLIDHGRTIGPTGCGGCATPACIAFRHATIGVSGAFAVDIYGVETPGHDWNVTWQPGGVTTVDPFDGTVYCQAVTPARTPTWGAIKSLYR